MGSEAGLLFVAYWGGFICIGLVVNRLFSAIWIGAVWGGIFKAIGIALVASRSYYGVDAGAVLLNMAVAIVGGALVTSAIYGLRRLVGRLTRPKELRQERKAEKGSQKWRIGLFSRIFESAGAAAFVVAYLAGGFPGGTIIMWASCNPRRLDGLDWVLSVVIPFYGPIYSLFECW